jgi:general secretion pathway protein M
MSAAFERLLAQWRALALRERWLVGAAIALMLFTLGQLSWRGGQAVLADLRADVQAQREALSLAQALDRAGPAAAAAAADAGVPLLTLAERSARETGVGAALKRLDGADGGRVRARLEGAPFGTLVRWLAAVQSSSGASIESITLQRSTDPGLVEANIVLLPAGR